MTIDRIRFIIIWFMISVSFSLAMVLFAYAEIVYNNNGSRDPFIPLVTPDGRLVSLEASDSNATIVLEGISYDKEKDSYVIINSEVLTIGDHVLGCTVFKIYEDRVILLQDKELTEYILSEEELE